MERLGLLVLIIYLIFSIRVTFKVDKTEYLNHKQKIFNCLLVWLIPFIWGFLIINIIRPTKPQVMTKNKRKMKKGNFSDNCENLTGMGGGDFQ